jgi:glycosyltransferase involved in cell wall biosynthesis
MSELENKKATIFIATYNQSDFLKSAIDSALGQNFPSDQFEVLVINDGSTDSTKEVLAAYGSSIRTIHQENIGLSATCNRGIKEAKGEYFIRLDSDDLFETNLISQSVQFLDSHSGCVGVLSDHILFNEKERKVITVDENDIYSMIACGVMMRTGQLREIRGYKKVFWEEYDLFLRLSSFGQFYRIPEPLYLYRRHDNNMTNSVVGRKEGWKELIQIHGKDKIIESGNYKNIFELNEVIKNED